MHIICFIRLRWNKQARAIENSLPVHTLPDLSYTQHLPQIIGCMNFIGEKLLSCIYS